jgi:hypothetical protein
MKDVELKDVNKGAPFKLQTLPRDKMIVLVTSLALLLHRTYLYCNILSSMYISVFLIETYIFISYSYIVHSVIYILYMLQVYQL